MKKVLIITLVLGVISMIFMFLHFLASSDIYKDYIGTSIVSNGIIGNIEKLPEWTACKGEWLILQLDYIIRFIFMIFVTVVLAKTISNYSERPSRT